jgi:two-component system response regulator FlrC
VQRVLIVEPCGELAADLLRAVRALGYAAEATPPERAVATASGASFDVALVDVSRERDLARLERLRDAGPRLALVACGGSASLELAIAAVKRGAREYLRKPFAIGALERALAAAPRSDRRTAAPPLLPSRDPAMQRCLALAEDAAATDATVQIVGESGTGKQRIARFIHQRSARREGPLEVVSCAGLPGTLAESELFGHERGAFVGAHEARSGRIAAAEGGTLLLADLSELPAALQPKILRLVQEREVEPVGALQPSPIDVRILATTKRDLAAEVAAGRFRADLAHRLDVIVLRVPPLRERLADLAPLAEAFLQRFAEQAGCEAPRLGAAGLARLEAHPFRGNLRELENLMRRAVLVSAGREIDVEALLCPRAASALPEADVEAHETLNLRELERHTIERSLRRAHGNRTLASRELGISVRTLRNKIRLYGLA